MTTPSAGILRWSLAVAGVLLIQGVTGAPAQDLPSLPGLTDLTPTSAPLPPEIRAFAKRLAGCNHWAGAEATDAERGAAIAQARFRLRCSTIAQDESRLRARFATSPAILDALDQADGSEE